MENLWLICGWTVRLVLTHRRFNLLVRGAGEQATWCLFRATAVAATPRTLVTVAN